MSELTFGSGIVGGKKIAITRSDHIFVGKPRSHNTILTVNAHLWYTWTRRHENVTNLKSVNDIEKLQKKNNNVGLSEEVRMTDAVSDYVKKSRDYL